MAIDTWFPLAVYYEDIADSKDHQAGLIDRIQYLYGKIEQKRTTDTTAWTGDVHAAEKIHADPKFDWITRQVEQHTLNYLQILGHDLEKIDLYIQRSWPVISEGEQSVSTHAHHTANISVVYYVLVPKEGDSGRLVLYNDASMNECTPAIGSAMTQGYASYNNLNFQSAAYQPVEGRIIIFPAKQSHGVEANQTGQQRISLAFDIVLVSRSDKTPGHYEYLMPPPEQWRKFGS